VFLTDTPYSGGSRAQFLEVRPRGHASGLFRIRKCEESRRFYDRKRAEGKRHTQAVLALARPCVNVLWALLRDGRCYELTPPAALAA
jgi:hypothetical protein